MVIVWKVAMGTFLWVRMWFCERRYRVRVQSPNCDCVRGATVLGMFWTGMTTWDVVLGWCPYREHWLCVWGSDQWYWLFVLKDCTNAWGRGVMVCGWMELMEGEHKDWLLSERCLTIYIYILNACYEGHLEVWTPSEWQVGEIALWSPLSDQFWSFFKFSEPLRPIDIFAFH